MKKIEGIMQPITSTGKLERVFLDVCGPLPRSGGRKQYKFIIIMFDHYSKFTKLYPINRATTKKILQIVIQQYIPELGAPRSIITDHGTQFRGRVWKETLLDLGVKTYKTSVYHPNSNPAERVLREVGRILRTYCFDKHQKWSDYITQTESFINLAYHEAIQDTPYTIMHEKLPPREISEIINFPSNPAYQFDNVRFHKMCIRDRFISSPK